MALETDDAESRGQRMLNYLESLSSPKHTQFRSHEKPTEDEKLFKTHGSPRKISRSTFTDQSFADHQNELIFSSTQSSPFASTFNSPASSSPADYASPIQQGQSLSCSPRKKTLADYLAQSTADGQDVHKTKKRIKSEHGSPTRKKQSTSINRPRLPTSNSYSEFPESHTSRLHESYSKACANEIPLEYAYTHFKVEDSEDDYIPQQRVKIDPKMLSPPRLTKQRPSLQRSTTCPGFL